MKCPYCEVKLENNKMYEKGDGAYKILKCSMCESGITVIGGNIRSYTTKNGEQTILNPLCG